VNLALIVQVQHTFQNFLQNGGNQVLVLDSIGVLQFDDVYDGAGAEEGHDHPEVGVIHEGNVVPAQILVQAG